MARHLHHRRVLVCRSTCSGPGLHDFIFELCYSGELPSILVRPLCPLPCSVPQMRASQGLLWHSGRAATLSAEKWQPRRRTWLTPSPCSQSTSEASGTFVLADKEGPERERRCAEL